MKVLAGIIGITILGACIWLYSKDTKIILNIQKHFKWLKLQPTIHSIDIIHSRTARNGKKVGFLEKDGVKKTLAKNKETYIQYLDFCKSKGLSLPENVDYILQKIDEAEDVLDPKAALDKKLQRAKKQYDEAYAIMSESGEALLSDRQKSIELIENVETLVNSIARHTKDFDKDIKQINLHRETFKTTIEFAKDQKKILKNATMSAGAGLAAGVGVVSTAPTAAMWVATTFGTASTGTAISALSGAAATNAALAWLGGGALAAGGGGMAAGHALLALAGPVGWGIAGTSLLTSVLFVWRKKIKAQESKKDEVARMERCTQAVKKAQGKIEEICLETELLYEKITEEYHVCDSMNGEDYDRFTDEQKERLGTMVNNTQSLSVLLNKTIC